MTKQKLTTQPYKGARDFYPEDMRVRNYIFETWRKVAKRFGFEEYDFPFLEPFELYAAKTGEEIVNNQLYSFIDRGDRKIAIRPEKTPSAARMVAGRFKDLPKPIKWFNIGNCWRFEKPQKGRGREFFQFDIDIFGVEGIEADVEVFSTPVEIMKEFGGNENMFEIRVCNRRLAEFYLKEIVDLQGGISEGGTQTYGVTKIVDSKTKVPEEEFLSFLKKARLSDPQIEKLQEFLSADIEFVKKFQDRCYGAREIVQFFEAIKKLGYEKYFKFAPEVMRGLDYYTGNVIEQFDLNPENSRSMFGGGRYDNLIGEFIDQDVPGVGYAMGDVTLLEFLKGWNLLPKFASETQYLVTLWPDKNDKYYFAANDITKKLRSKGRNVEMWLEKGVKLEKQLKYADQKGIPLVVIAGEEELAKGLITIRDMRTREQQKVPLANLDDTL